MVAAASDLAPNIPSGPTVEHVPKRRATAEPFRSAAPILDRRFYHAGSIQQRGFGKMDLTKWIRQTGFGGFGQRIQRGEVVISQATDMRYFFILDSAKWI